MAFWQLEARDVERLRGGDGGRFREFVVNMIRAQAHIAGIPESVIHCDSRAMKDGGVDCQVDEGREDESAGRLRVRTVWQFKGTSKENLSEEKVRAEVRKPHAAECLRAGFAYRFCLADDLSAENEAERWLGWLSDEANKIAGREVDVQVLGSTTLAAWASHFPAVILKTGLRQETGFLHLDAWRPSITAPTPKYEENPAWAATKARLLAHCNFAEMPPRAVELVQGVAGVGKTRLVFETVAQIGGAWALVLYSPDGEGALSAALDLANDPILRAVLVVDECSLNLRQKLESNLLGHRNRVRVVAIDNLGERLAGLETHPMFLERLPDDVVTKVLESNFADRPDSDRRVAVALAQGFLRIAVDICRHGWGGGIGPVREQLEDYYRDRVPESKRKAVEAISLLTRVGWSQEVAAEFEALCELCQIPVKESREIARSLKDAPGFVAIGGRYFYITPEAIAEVALNRAYSNWIEPDPAGFFNRMPASLEEAFLTRVARCSNHRLREVVAAHSGKWTASLVPEDLLDKKKAERLIRLVETEPETYLPGLRQLVEQATSPVLKSVSGSSADGWGPRRKFVWLCERLIAFPQFFHDSEAILFRLALHENEPEISNNATEIWKQLFRVFLSGTAVPYLERLEVLKKRLKSAETSEVGLAVGGLAQIFETHFSRIVPPPVFAGVASPESWRPSTLSEEQACLTAAFNLIEKVLSKSAADLQSRIVALVIRNLRFLLGRGHFDWAKRWLDGRVSLPQLPRVLEELDWLLQDGKEPNREMRVPPEYFAVVRTWRQSLVPQDLHAQLVSELGRPFYHVFDEQLEAEWRSRLRHLASQLLADRERFAVELPWLASADAISSGPFGEELGGLDAEAVLLTQILESSFHGVDTLARGYAHGLLGAHPHHSVTLNQQLDRLESDRPVLAFNVALAVPASTNVSERALKLFDAGKLPVESLGSLRFVLTPDGLTDARLEQLLERVSRVHAESVPSARRVGLNLSHAWLQYNAANGKKPSVSPALAGYFHRLLDTAPTHDPSEEYQWICLLRFYSLLDPNEAIQLACRRLGDTDSSSDFEVTGFLHEQAAQHPPAVMEALGQVLLNEERGWKLKISGIGGLLSALPTRVVLDWLDRRGLAGARTIASSLPRPRLSKDGHPTVPALTESVLEKFGDDEEVSDGFICGSGVRSYSGDIAGQHDQEAKFASGFLGHRLPVIRKWAHREKASAEHLAARHRFKVAERMVPR